MPLSPILRPQGLNISGQCYLDVVPVTDVVSMPFPVVLNVTGDVVLQEGKNWIRVQLAPPGSRLVENWVLVNGEQVSDLTISGFAAKDELEKLAALWAAKTDRWLVVLTCMDGDKLIAGRPEEGCRLQMVKRDRGDDGAVLNGYNLEFTNRRLEPVPFYQGALPAYVPPGECAPAAVLINGVEVAIVNSGDEEDIAVTDPDGVPVGEWNEEEDRWEVEATGSCDSAVASLRDTEGTLLDTIMIPSGGTDNVIAPDGTVRTTDAAATVGAVLSGGTLDLPQSVIKYKDTANADQETFAMDTDFASGTLRPHGQVPRRELTLNGAGTGQYVTLADLLAGSVPNITTPRAITASWAAGNDETIPVVMPAEYQGASYAYVSNTGTNGTITVSVDGGATYAAPPFTVGTLGVSFKRTTYAAAGSVLYEA